MIQKSTGRQDYCTEIVQAYMSEALGYNSLNIIVCYKMGII